MISSLLSHQQIIKSRRSSILHPHETVVHVISSFPIQPRWNGAFLQSPFLFALFLFFLYFFSSCARYIASRTALVCTRVVVLVLVPSSSSGWTSSGGLRGRRERSTQSLKSQTLAPAEPRSSPKGGTPRPPPPHRLVAARRGNPPLGMDTQSGERRH